jgi:hypothetical protein
MWRLGGANSSFMMGRGSETAWQHDARLRPDGTVTLFDNGSNPRVHYQSRAVRLKLDTKRRAVSVARAYTHPGGALLADSQGNAQTLGDGSVVIGWGAIPGVSELAEDGSLLFDAHLPPGISSYRAFRFRWSGRPLWAPAVSARLLATGDSTVAFASWNGASDVSLWRVLAGERPDSLSARATMPNSGFESSITFPDAYAYVAVQALDRSQRLLGTSPTVKVQNPATPAKAG